MECDWVFLNQDKTTDRVTLNEASLPSIGDGKAHASRGYQVLFTATNLVSNPNPIILAFEHL